MICAWCQKEITPGQKYAVLPKRGSGSHQSYYHRSCLIKFEREVLWGLFKEGHDVSEGTTHIRETPTSPHGA